MIRGSKILFENADHKSQLTLLDGQRNVHKKHVLKNGLIYHKEMMQVCPSSIFKSSSQKLGCSLFLFFKISKKAENRIVWKCLKRCLIMRHSMNRISKIKLVKILQPLPIPTLKIGNN
jgi:hypothetical protein